MNSKQKKTPAKVSKNNPYKVSDKTIRLRELSELCGINTRVLSSYMKDGCDVFNTEEFKLYLDNLKVRPGTIKASFYTPPEASSIITEGNRDLDTLKLELLHTKDKHEATRIKTQLEGLKAAQQLEVLNGSYISITDAENALSKIGSVVRSMIVKMQSDLPPQLYGMSQAQMQIRLRDYTTKLLDELTNVDAIWENK